MQKGFNFLLIRTRPNILKCLVVIVFCLFLGVSPAKANEFEEGIFIRDAEIESILKSYMRPLFQAAKLDPKNMKINLVVNKQVNAMATVGYRFILFTGFLLRTENVGQVIGVLAHETGHIADGHVARVFGEAGKMASISIAHVLVGIAAALAGSPEAGVAIGLGGVGAAQNNFLHYHRGQEAAADQDALKYLESLGWSAKGLEEFFSILRRHEIFSTARQDPYLRTHPLTQDRIQSVKGHLQKSKYADTPFPKEFVNNYHILKAKLFGFLYPMKALQKYTETDTSFAGLYARAIANYRLQNIEEALKLLDVLIQKKPQNPYLWELKGQIMFENGRLPEALVAYKKAVKMAPKAHLIKVGYAQALVESKTPSHAKQAERLLKQSLEQEKTNPMLWRQLAIIYGRNKQVGLMALALAEEAFIKGEKKAAVYQAKRAVHKLAKNSSPWLRAKDLLAAIEYDEAMEKS